MRGALAITAAVLLGSLRVAFAHSETDAYQCESDDWDRRIAACTRMIQGRGESKSDRAKALINRGVDYTAKGDYARAIADFNSSLRFDPKDSLAYSGRGNAKRQKSDIGGAIADYGKAIALGPSGNSTLSAERWLALVYSNRSRAYQAEGDFLRAMADADAAVKHDPGYALAFNVRGRAYLYNGELAKALADFNQASELDPKYGYAALWLDIASKRSGLPGRLEQAAARLDMAQWPAPVIRFYLGQLTPEAVMAAADDPNPHKKAGQLCEAIFFRGERALQQDARDEAARLFGIAVASCPKEFDERTAAGAELKALAAAR